MEKVNTEITQRFQKLAHACHKYPAIELNRFGKPKIYKGCKGRAKDGFIEKFCK